MNKYLKWLISLAIVISLFYVLFKKVGISEIINVFVNVKVEWLLLFLLAYMVIRLFSIFQFSVLFRAVDRKIGFYTLFKYFHLTTGLGKILPAKIGSISFAWLLNKKKGVPYGEAFAFHTIDKILMNIFSGIIAIFGFFFVLELPVEMIYTIFGILALMVITIMLFSSSYFRELIKRYVLRKYSYLFKNFSKTFKSLFKKDLIYLILVVVVKIFTLFMTFVAFSFIFKAFGAAVPFYQVAVVSSILTVINILPLPFAGLGVYEVSGVYLFSLFGVPLAVSTNYMLFLLIFKYAFFFVIYLLYNREL